jgi:hypothetical protein
MQDKPLAQKLFAIYARKHNYPLLKKFYAYIQKPDQAANLCVHEAFRSEKLADRVRCLDLARMFFQEEKSNVFATRATEEEIALLEHQRAKELRLEKKKGDVDYGKSTFLDLSVSEYIDQLLRLRRDKDAVEVAKQFKVPPKRMMLIEIKVYSSQRRWDDLSNLVKGKKTVPCGFLPFVQACIDEGNPQEAVQYIKKLPDVAEQLTLLCGIG